MRQIISLNDSEWFIGAVTPQPSGERNDFARVEGWLPATVPGDVRLDLLRVNKIPNPFLGRNNEASQWIDEYDWWYRREMDSRLLRASNPDSDTRTFLVFEGIDYESAVYWDDVELGRHIGMFSRQTYEIPPNLLTNQKQRVAVRVSGGNQLPHNRLHVPERAWAASTNRLLPHADHTPSFPDRYATLKCQMSFGWDFAPRLLTCGIWDEAYIVQTRAVLIRDIWVQGVPNGRVNVRLDLDATRPYHSQIRFEIQPKNFSAPTQSFDEQLQLDASGTHAFSLQIEQPHVWNPWERGEPHLYTLRVIVSDDAGAMDSYETVFGLRTIDLQPNPGARVEDGAWMFIVNGEPLFIRGANWVPADAIPARVTNEDYDELLQLARDANINLLRVWGGGLKEKHRFYELCDELGILVWQEFPFAGAGVDHFPHDREYLDTARQECHAIVRALRNHPSVALWCGGNEFIPRANRHLVNLVRNAVASEDGTRPFKPASPSYGESHNWRVWHSYANTRDYLQDAALFFGEFGLQALPIVETLNRFLPDDALFPPNEEWEYHNAELNKLWRYALAVNPNIETLEEFVAASQEAQLRGLQIAIEHGRRSKPRVSGCVFWQFNEPWHSINWSVLDYTRRPKRAYWKIKELYNPVLVSFAYPLWKRSAGEIVSGEVWLINDTLRELQGTLSAWHNDVPVLALDVSSAANRARAVQSLDLALADGSNALRFEFRAEGLTVTNEYDLNYCDAGEINRRRALLTDAAAWLRTTT